MFLNVAIGVIALGIAVMIGFIVVSSVKTAVGPTQSQLYVNASNGTTDAGYVALNNTLNSAQSTTFSGFSLLVVGVIIAAAFGLIAIFGKR